jgi:hypothetical protein
VALARVRPLEYECDFRERIGQLHKGEDHWWRVRTLRPTRGIVTDIIAALETALPRLDAHAEPRSRSGASRVSFAMTITATRLP